ncbi:hypothetical protein Z043_115604 [Scleropages formosus]|uniref:Calpastatin n=1 Tax=Scleropages formosus TaxID=113540 RepID=A0A0P7UDU5_SCLFO|nr:hypothetical protein Z043_115604 [Scleropages formosus]
MPLSALSALGETLPAPETVLKPCKISPAAIIEEGSLKASTAIRVGEREDSLPPKYRTPKETVPQPPAPDKMPSLVDAALGSLEEDLLAQAVTPNFKSSMEVPTKAKQQNIIVEKHVGKLGERDDTLPPNYRFPKAPLDGGQNQEKDTAFKKESEKVVEKMPASGEGPGQNGSDVLPVTS